MPIPYPEASRTLLRDTIVDAVDQLARTRGWAAASMSDVATAAGVSRQTVYNEFGSRQGLVEAYVRREVEALIGEVEAEVRSRAGDARGAVQAAFALFLKLASDEPLVQVLVASERPSDDGGLTRLLTGLGRSVATERIGELIVEVWPQVSAADARLLAETLARLAISHALLPTEDASATATAIARLVGPFVDELLAD
ncbi:MAG TPA: TetR family transcriptional regulator [Jatrophihabitantaceae bacterium]|nr:TetR family transcriptional regulator [Jatrophihabitantaceae bacterium]